MGYSPISFWLCSLGAFFLLLRTLFAPLALNKALLASQLKAEASQVLLSLLLEPQSREIFLFAVVLFRWTQPLAV